MSRRIRWEENLEDRIFVGWAELRPGQREKLFAIIAPHGWNDCRLLYNDALHGQSKVKFLRGTGSQSCKQMATVIERLNSIGSVRLDRLTWCRQYDKAGSAYWTELDIIEWVNHHSRWHRAWREDG